MSSLLASRRAAPVIADPSRTTMYQRLSYSRIEKRRVAQARCLWWWSRHGTWSTPNEDNVEDRMQKYQKIMRYRYSRALRRRAMWERENSPPQWVIRGPSKWFSAAWSRKPLSTTESLQARLNDEDSSLPRNDRHWEEAQRDFEAFKAEVDRAIAKDPVGFLFGRRLQGPLSSNNSSWTSFARIFDSKESKDSFEAKSSTSDSSKQIKIENLDSKSSATVTTPASHPSNVQSHAQQQPTPGSAYVYDPVSGRNVLKHNIDSESPKSFTERFFGSLFAENGVPEAKPMPRSHSNDGKSAKQRLENSRSYEYRLLRSSAIGNNIDTTSQFGGKYEDQHDRMANHEWPKSAATDDVPPFTGTTYEASHVTQPKVSSLDMSWLENEGFRDQSISTNNTDVQSKLQPSLDRMRDANPVSDKKIITKLQPSIDRISTSTPKLRVSQCRAPLHVEHAVDSVTVGKASGDLVADTREDLDLLRPSDVRAATKSARVTKEQIDQGKHEARNKLEEEFVRRMNDAADEPYESNETTARLRRVLSNSSSSSISKHVKRYPRGIVARSIQSTKHINEKPGLSSDTSLSKLGITKEVQTGHGAIAEIHVVDKEISTASLQAHKMTSEQVKEAQGARDHLRTTIKTLNEQSEASVKARLHGFSRLANALREAYESERGPIGLKPETELTTKDEVTNMNQDSSPLRSATVKPGVPRYPYIERHTQEFEPQLVAIREKAKGIKRSLYDISTSLQELEVERTTAGDIDDLGKNKKLDDDSVNMNSAQQQPEKTFTSDLSTRQLAPDEKQRLNAMRTLNDRIKREPHLLEKPMLRPQRSEVSSTTPDRDSLEIPVTPVSPYVLLTYNRKTGEVDTTELVNLLGQDTSNAEEVNPIRMMSNLNYPAAFVSHFVILEKAGYTLVSGGGDLLIFQKHFTEDPTDQIRKDALNSIQAIKSDINDIRNKIAVEEARNQPQIPSRKPKTLTAATVLDEIPSSEYVPGPASHIGKSEPIHQKKSDKKARRIRRQEQVFSGTMRPSTGGAEPDAGPGPTSQSSSSNSTDRPGFFQRLRRAIRTTILTTVSLAVGAYTIGIVAEGIGAHAQATQGAGGRLEETGPRKKVVMPMGQSSRDQ